MGFLGDGGFRRRELAGGFFGGIFGGFFGGFTAGRGGQRGGCSFTVGGRRGARGGGSSSLAGGPRVREFSTSLAQSSIWVGAGWGGIVGGGRRGGIEGREGNNFQVFKFLPIIVAKV